MSNYATTNDLVTMYRPLSDSETARAAIIIDAIYAEFRVKAEKRGRSLDSEILSDDNFAKVVKGVVCDATMRSINKDTNSEAATQMSQSANGYTVSITPFNAGGGIFITRSEYAKLGLNTQRWGALDIYGQMDDTW